MYAKNCAALICILLGSNIFSDASHTPLEVRDIIASLHKHIINLTAIKEAHRTVFSRACEKVGTFFNTLEYEKLFKHPLMKHCIIQIRETHTIDPLFSTWMHFIEHVEYIDDRYDFLEDFSHIVFIIYHNLIECMQQQ